MSQSVDPFQRIMNGQYIYICIFFESSSDNYERIFGTNHFFPYRIAYIQVYSYNTKASLKLRLIIKFKIFFRQIKENY